jgi:hypothetical protein
MSAFDARRLLFRVMNHIANHETRDWGLNTYEFVLLYDSLCECYWSIENNA